MHTPRNQGSLLRLTLAALAISTAGVLGLGACGGPAKKVDTESIRRNADDADRDLDRESDKNKAQE